MKDEEILECLRYLREHDEGNVSELLDQGFSTEVIDFMRYHIISINKVLTKYGRYKVTEFGKRYIDVVL
jgi:hypothetical protein